MHVEREQLKHCKLKLYVIMHVLRLVNMFNAYENWVAEGVH